VQSQLSFPQIIEGVFFYSFPPPPLAKENFTQRESQAIWNHLEIAAVRSHHNPRQAFEDFLEMSVCSLSGGQMEEDYMKLVPSYSEGEKGRRAIDSFPVAFAALVEAMERTQLDILGDLFQGGVTFGENGQFFTPDHLCKIMAQMTMTGEETGKRIIDPACGSGRTLLAAGDINPNNEFYGIDVDLRCARMTAINLALRNLYGWVVWGNALSSEEWLYYRTGFNLRGGVIEKIEPARVPETVKTIVEEQVATNKASKQLSLF
jgi:hypothetical protein